MTETAQITSWPYGGRAAREEIKPSPRIEMLRENYLNWKPSAGWEKAYWWTKIYRKTEGQPFITRRAKALKALIENVSLWISPGELIVGVLEGSPRRAQANFDLAWDWYIEEADTLSTRWPDPIQIDEETKRKYKELGPYWKNKCVKDVWLNTMNEVAPWALKVGFQTGLVDSDAVTYLGLGHMHLGYSHLIANGASGLRKKVEEEKGRLAKQNPNYPEKTLFYNALSYSCDVLATIGERYSMYAQELAQKETNIDRKADYLRVADTCRQVPANPARTFHEALQAIWFAHLITHLEAGAWSYGFGRMDQYLYPYYKKDLEDGTMTQEEAQELLDCFWIKVSEIPGFLNKNAAKYYAGHPTTEMLNVGGLDKDGKDATNELSYMMLQATINTRVIQPQIGVLWHPDMPEDLVKKATSLTSLGTGHPSNFNAHLMVEMLQELGLPPEDARGGCFVGCVETSGGDGTTCTNCQHGSTNTAASVEFLLTNGLWRMTGDQVAPRTGDPREFKSFDDVLEAFRKHTNFLFMVHSLQGNIADQIHAERAPYPFASLLMPHCIETGVDITAGGAKYTFGPGHLTVGVADTVDSLAAIKHLIYETKELTWDQLLHALDTNFQDTTTEPAGPTIKQMCLSVPKYGNDVQWVDKLARRIMRMLPEESEKFVSPITGKAWRVGIVPVSANVPFGMVLGALPSGRPASEPLAEGCSPKQGMDVSGPTAAVLSVTNWDHGAFTDGTQLNMRFTPETMNSDADLNKLGALIKAFMAKGGNHVQFNVVSSDLLRDAQDHPEDYPGLMVRVAGYSAYFAELDPSVQNDIIARTEHSL